MVKLKPPQIAKETLSEYLICTRPMREGKFNISAEQVENKTIVHCYGHGGSGWTTLFGSVSKAIELFETTHPNKETPIRIIGSGSMGLTTAIELKRLGYCVAGIITKDLYDLPSWKAAGYFALVSIKTSLEEQESVNQNGIESFLSYQKIFRGEHPYISRDAVRYIPVYCSESTEAGVEDLEAKGLIPPKELVSLDFGNGIVHRDYVKYMTYFMDTSMLMKQLIVTVKKMNINIEMRQIKAFDEIKEAVVFNTSGLGSREINNDQQMIPVRGHLITLNAEAGSEHMDYMIFTKVKQDGKDEYVSMFPKTLSVSAGNSEGIPCVGLLGGTYIPHVDQLPVETQAELDRVEFKKMLDRNCLFFHGRPFKEINYAITSSR